MLLPHLKFEKVDLSDTHSPKCIFSKDNFEWSAPEPNRA